MEQIASALKNVHPLPSLRKTSTIGWRDVGDAVEAE
jgi:hypothetical protein